MRAVGTLRRWSFRFLTWGYLAAGNEQGLEFGEAEGTVSSSTRCNKLFFQLLLGSLFWPLIRKGKNCNLRKKQPIACFYKISSLILTSSDPKTIPRPALNFQKPAAAKARGDLLFRLVSGHWRDSFSFQITEGNRQWKQTFPFSWNSNCHNIRCQSWLAYLMPQDTAWVLHLSE